MNIEDTRLFRVGVNIVALGTVWWLSARVGLWPNGPLTISSAFLFVFCLAGVERVYGFLLGIVAIAVWPKRLVSRPHR
jgi:O-antigen ligase